MKRKALLVGIDDYAPRGWGNPDLRGCVNDVRDMVHTLNTLGIIPPGPGSMKIVTDARATRANILKALNWLIKGAKKGDLLIFHYSGHGSQVPDIEGDELEAPPKKDETICPHDFATAGMIKDDDLCDIFSKLEPGANLEVIIDACHSGTGTRDMDALAAVPEAGQVTYRYAEPPVDYGYFLDANPTLPLKGFFKAEPGAKAVAKIRELNHVLWAACRDSQTSAEASIDGVWRGVFTYCFCKVIRRAGLEIIRKKLGSLVSADIKRMGYAQVPQLEGTGESIKEKIFT